MFTGLIETLGRVCAVDGRGTETRLRILTGDAIRDFVHGESIAVNGVCLTVETWGSDWFEAYASAETLRATSLGALRPGSGVNLERAVAVGSRLGGHIVSGHVDCLAEVASVRPEGQSQVIRFSFPAEFGPQVVAKGSVALDGISLTVNHCGSDFLEVNIIPATQAETTIASWKAGYRANMETDILGKYVQRMLGAYVPGVPAVKVPESASDSSASTSGGGITEDFLRKHGF